MLINVYMMILSMTHSFSEIISFACLLALCFSVSIWGGGGGGGGGRYFTVSYRPAFTDSVTKSDF